MYTLRSRINGKYISSLFSDTHEETFNADTLEQAYKWDSIKPVLININFNDTLNIQDCEVIDLNEQAEIDKEINDWAGTLPEFLKPQA